MVKQKISTLTVVLSFIFFMIASAFTVIPEGTDKNDYHFVSSCETCTFSGGTPSGCTEAQYCGMSICIGSCNLEGVLCGECAGPERN